MSSAATGMGEVPGYAGVGGNASRTQSSPSGWFWAAVASSQSSGRLNSCRTVSFPVASSGFSKTGNLKQQKPPRRGQIGWNSAAIAFRRGVVYPVMVAMNRDEQR